MDQVTSLRVFLSVADEGSFSAAAQKLSLSKSAVSKHIAALEDRLGARLLNRTTRQVSLTEEGRTFLRHASRALEELEEASANIGAMKAEPVGTLHVSVASSFGLRYLTPALPAFLSRYPRLSIDLDLSDRFVDLVAEGVDVAIRIGDLSDSDLVARRLASSQALMVASPAYLEKRGRPRHPADLAGHACLLYRGRAGPRYWLLGDDPQTRETIRVDGPLISNNGDALKAAAIAGQGIARLPSFLLDDALETGALVEVLAEHRPAPLTINAVYLPGRHLASKVRYFIDFLAQRLDRGGLSENTEPRLTDSLFRRNPSHI